jgi:hypothetical protein
MVLKYVILYTLGFDGGGEMRFPTKANERSRQRDKSFHAEGSARPSKPKWGWTWP